MTDRYLGQSPTLGDVYIGAATVTPSDSAAIETTRALWIGGAGNIKLTLVDGSVVTLSSVAAGTRLPVRATLVWATGTTATLITALY